MGHYCYCYYWKGGVLCLHITPLTCMLLQGVDEVCVHC
jgi:hypothetical protein